MQMRYSVHITFSDGSNPYVRYGMSRPEYAAEMRRWKSAYLIELDRVEETSERDRLIFVTATSRTPKMGRGKRGYYYRGEVYRKRSEGRNGQKRGILGGAGQA